MDKDLGWARACNSVTRMHKAPGSITERGMRKEKKRKWGKRGEGGRDGWRERWGKRERGRDKVPAKQA